MNEVKPLTAEPVRMLKYFLKYKGDITRYGYYEECLPALEKYHPEIPAAVRALEIAERTLNAVVNNLEEPDDD